MNYQKDTDQIKAAQAIIQTNGDCPECLVQRVLHLSLTEGATFAISTLSLIRAIQREAIGNCPIHKHCVEHLRGSLQRQSQAIQTQTAIVPEDILEDAMATRVTQAQIVIDKYTQEDVVEHLL